jgi:hypothetical protein
MRTSINSLRGLLLMCLSTVCWGASPVNPVASPFVAVLPNVTSATHVPILLPSNLPPPLDQSVHYATGSGNDQGYEITLYFEEGAGDAGFAGYFSGKSDKTSLAGHKIKLDHGLTGYFKPSTCGGSCSPSQIEWRVNGVHYTAQLQLNTNVTRQQSAMVEVANSAISAGPR